MFVRDVEFAGDCEIVTRDCLQIISILLFVNKGRLRTMVWIFRFWGTASAVLVIAMLIAALHSWSPVEAIRNSQLADFDRPKPPPASPTMGGLELPGSSSPFLSSGRVNDNWPPFREAPAFRNGIQCAFMNQTQSDVEATVHIAMTLDVAYLRGSMASIFSILKHSTCPESISFHFLVSDQDAELQSLIYSTFPFLRFKVYHFDETMVRSRISASVRQALEQPLNYARSYLADILEPCIKRVIYLDSDLIVVDDIVKLWGTSLGSHAVGAPEYCHANFTNYFTAAFWSNSSLTKTFKGRNPCYFNTGVMIMDLAKWRKQTYRSRIEAWMETQKERRIYELGSLPPFLLVFAGLVKPIEHRWNQHGLGGDNLEGRCRALHSGPVSLMHWSGRGKPWIRLDKHTACAVDHLWAPYDLLLPAAASNF